jgi:hypothetical protein
MFCKFKNEGVYSKKGVSDMDELMMKKLNKQALWFVVIHTLFIFNLAIDVFEFM